MTVSGPAHVARIRNDQPIAVRWQMENLYNYDRNLLHTTIAVEERRPHGKLADCRARV